MQYILVRTNLHIEMKYLRFEIFIVILIDENGRKVFILFNFNLEISLAEKTTIGRVNIERALD